MSYATDFKQLARVNTGAHFLDSGGLYGRQYNRPALDEKTPLYFARPYGDGTAMLLINAAVMLDERYEIDQKATRHFRLWAHFADPNDNRHWLDLAQEYCALMVERGKWERDAESDNPFVWYTYNSESDMDQDFQIVAPGIYHGPILIQMHNGADARGGLTAPVVAVGSGFGDGGPLDVELQIQPYCADCGEGGNVEGSYAMEKAGWRQHVNKRTVRLICPKCGKRGQTYPIFEIWEG